jgi:Rap1a immunity proteins
MTARSLAFIAFTALGLLSTAALADEDKRFDTQVLVQMCKLPYQSTGGAFCLAYVRGVADVMLANGAYGRVHDRYLGPFRLCVDERLTGADLIQAFIEWAEKHPHDWTEKSLIGVSSALAETWPCPNLRKPFRRRASRRTLPVARAVAGKAK